MALGVSERPVQVPDTEHRPSPDSEDGDHAASSVRIAVRGDELLAPLHAAPLGMVERRQPGGASTCALSMPAQIASANDRTTSADSSTAA